MERDWLGGEGFGGMREEIGVWVESRGGDSGGRWGCWKWWW